MTIQNTSIKSLVNDLSKFDIPFYSALAFSVFIFSVFLMISFQEYKIKNLEIKYSKSVHGLISLQQHWGQLRLEKHHLTALAKVENIARNELDMIFVNKNKVIVRKKIDLILVDKNEVNSIEVKSNEKKLSK